MNFKFIHIFYFFGDCSVYETNNYIINDYYLEEYINFDNELTKEINYEIINKLYKYISNDSIFMYIFYLINFNLKSDLFKKQNISFFFNIIGNDWK